MTITIPFSFFYYTVLHHRKIFIVAIFMLYIFVVSIFREIIIFTQSHYLKIKILKVNEDRSLFDNQKLFYFPFKLGFVWFYFVTSVTFIAKSIIMIQMKWNVNVFCMMMMMAHNSMRIYREMRDNIQPRNISAVLPQNKINNEHIFYLCPTFARWLIVVQKENLIEAKK